MAEKVVINSSRVVQEVTIVSQPNITKVYINNQNGGGGSITGQNNTWREVFLGYYSTPTELQNLFNQELIVSETENVMILVAFTDPSELSESTPLITRYKFARGKGTWLPIPSVLGTDILFESEAPPSSGDIGIIIGGPNTQTYDLGDITGTDIWDFVTANGPYDMSNPALTYLFLSVTDGVIYLHQFIGANGVYGSGETPAAESDFLLITTNETPPVTYNLKVNETGETPLEFINQIEFDGATVISDGPNKAKITIIGGGSSGTLIREQFDFVASQTFTLANNYAQVYNVMVQGQGALHTSQYDLISPNQIEILDTLDSGDYIVVIYSTTEAGALPYYTQAEVDAIVAGITSGKDIIYKSVVDSSVVTGTTTPTFLQAITIPANRVSNGDVLKLKVRGRKTGTNGVLSLRCEGIVDAFFQTDNATRLGAEMEREFVVKGSITEYPIYSQNLSSPNGNVNSFTQATVDWTVSQTIDIGLELQNASDSAVLSYIELYID